MCTDDLVAPSAVSPLFPGEREPSYHKRIVGTGEGETQLATMGGSEPPPASVCLIWFQWDLASVA